MNVSGASGVPASLPMPASAPGSAHEVPPGAGAATGAAATAGPSTMPGSSTTPGSTAAGQGSTETVGELHIPGSKPASKVTEATPHVQAPKPAAAPPLKGLTVAEIRAMLGVPSPQHPDAATTASTSTSGGMPAVQAALQRYV
jgi:hypothetical protein